MTSAVLIPRCGDAVKHGPTGETWEVAYCIPERDQLSPSGWPETIARLQDCELVRVATDEQHKAAVARWLQASARKPCLRRSRIRHLYGHVLEVS